MSDLVGNPEDRFSHVATEVSWFYLIYCLGGKQQMYHRVDKQADLCFCCLHNKMSRVVRKPTMWFSNRSDKNRAVQA